MQTSILKSCAISQTRQRIVVTVAHHVPLLCCCTSSPPYPVGCHRGMGVPVCGQVPVHGVGCLVHVVLSPLLHCRVHSLLSSSLLWHVLLSLLHCQVSLPHRWVSQFPALALSRRCTVVPLHAVFAVMLLHAVFTVVLLCVTSEITVTGTGVQEHIFLLNCTSASHLHALHFFPCKGKVFLLQESHCNIANLSTLVVAYDVVCVTMLTHISTHASAQHKFVCINRSHDTSIVSMAAIPPGNS